MSEKYLTVTALTRYIKRKIDTDYHLKDIWLMGEISNFKHHNRGHMYLTIKDEKARIQAVMFAGRNRYLKFMPENGMKVIIRGEVSVFEAFGQYQLYINQMEPDGIGALFLAYEQLKEKLTKQGYFDERYKKSIPFFPKHIGVITSPTGAAVKDVITTIKRRYPIVQITVFPVLVQGERAKESITSAIKQANEMRWIDVLIVGRGGGSIEELWSFNEELVAKAIFDSNIPIVSAVGHETDHTISDFIADLRAPTPTGAAEIVVPSQQELNHKVTTLEKRLTKSVNHLMNIQQRTLSRLKESYAFRYPEQLIKQKELELDKMLERLERVFANLLNIYKEKYTNVYTRLMTQHPEKQLNESKKFFNQLIRQYDQAFQRTIEKKSNRLSLALEKLTLLNPLEVMRRGFAIPYTFQGELIKSKNQVNEDDLIQVNVVDGQIDCRVTKVGEKENE